MKEGKLNWDDLKEVIEEGRGALRDEVRIHSGIGEDCSILSFGDYECVVSTDPITGANSNIGRLAVNINCNDVAACGVEPMGILVTILAPEHCTLQEIKCVMKEIGEECRKLNVEVLGGHTEITKAVNKLIVSCTVIGRGDAGRAISTSGAKIGDDIVITKNLALEGTSILANDYKARLESILSQEEIEEAIGYINSISVIKEGKVAGDFGVNSMHDITEGGVLGALWEVSEASGVGFKVFEDKMPITRISKKVCDYFNIDPLKLVSSGSMLITVRNGKELIDLLQENGVKAVVIGNITRERGLIVKKDVEIDVPPPERDELFTI